jgi:hypothetical protein
MTTPAPCIPVSWGELIDKIAILRIKREKLSDAGARVNVERELTPLEAIAGPVLAKNGEILELAVRLKALNEALWETEDRIRGKEASGAFDAEFIELARSVYRQNDARGALKREISLRLGSQIVEEKSYRPY